MPPKITEIDKLYKNLKRQEKKKPQRKPVKDAFDGYASLETKREKLARSIVRDFENKDSIIDSYEEDEDFSLILQSYGDTLLEKALSKYIALKDIDNNFPRKTKKVPNTLDFFKNYLVEVIAPTNDNKQRYLEKLEVASEEILEENRLAFIEALRKNSNKLDKKFISNLVGKIVDDRKFVSLINMLTIDQLRDLANTYDQSIDLPEFIENKYRVESDEKEPEEDEEENVLEPDENTEADEEGEIPDVYVRQKKPVVYKGQKNSVKDLRGDDLMKAYYERVQNLNDENTPVKDISLIVNKDIERQLDRLYVKYRKEIKQDVDQKDLVVLGFDKNCYDLQLYKPWIYRFKSSWIHTDDPKILEKYSISVQDPIVVNGTKYYLVNRLFYILQCNNRSRKGKTQRGLDLTLYETDGTPVEVKVVHLLDTNKIVVQDEALFQKENEYMKIKSILNKKDDLLMSFDISRSLISLSKSTIKRNILNLTQRYNLTIDEDKLDNYIDRVVGSIVKRVESRKLPVRDFIRYISDIVIYLDDRMLGEYAKTFQNRLVKFFYSSDKLLDITMENKFEELYKNSKYNSELKNTISQRIEYYRNLIIDEIAEKAVLNMNALSRKGRDFEKYVEKTNLDIEDLRQQCKNKDIVDENLSEYLIYREEETGDLYCISLYNIGKSNPYTGKPYPLSVQRELEQLDSSTMGDYFNYTLYGEDAPEIELTPGLLNIVFKNIKEMENKIYSVKDLDEDKTCEYCSKHINGGNALETVIKHDSKSEVVAFCKISCFEEWDVKKPKDKTQKMLEVWDTLLNEYDDE